MKTIYLSEVLALYGVEAEGDVTIDCPACERPSKLNINIEKGAFRCPACDLENGTQGRSPFTLYGMLEHKLKPNRISQIQRKELIKELNKKLEKGDKSKKKIKITSNKHKNLARKANKRRTHEVLTFLYEHTVLYDDHYNDLIYRGMQHEQIVNGPYRSFPFTQKERNYIENKIVELGIVVEGVAGFWFDGRRWHLRNMPAGLMIFHRDVEGYFNGVQIRVDNEDFEAKYLWLFSHDKNLGAEASAVNNFVGGYNEHVVITEGGLKANVINALTGKSVISIPGITTTKTLIDDLKFLQSKGAKYFYTAVDMDYHDNVNVRLGRDRLHKMLEDDDIKFKPLEWDSDKGKGLDDFVFYHKYIVNDGQLGRLRHEWNNNVTHRNPDPNSKYKIKS